MLVPPALPPPPRSLMLAPAVRLQVGMAAAQQGLAARLRRLREQLDQPMPDRIASYQAFMSQQELLLAAVPLGPLDGQQQMAADK